MNIFRGLSVIALWLVASGCETVNTDYDRPARIADPDEQSRAALRSVVDGIFGRQVLLADDALTSSSMLTIERSLPGTIDNPNPMGRTMEAPFRFQLVINGSDCFLIDQRDQSRHKLDNTTCEEE